MLHRWRLLWISNFVLHITVHMIIYPCLDKSWIMLVRGARHNRVKYIFTMIRLKQRGRKNLQMWFHSSKQILRFTVCKFVCFVMVRFWQILYIYSLQSYFMGTWPLNTQVTEQRKHKKLHASYETYRNICMIIFQLPLENYSNRIWWLYRSTLVE